MSHTRPGSTILNITAIGDSFVRWEIMIEALEEYLGPEGYALNVYSGQVDWPEQPLVNGKEVSEFRGNPEWVADLAGEADVLVTHVAPVPESVLKASTRLQIVACCRGGPKNINVDAATALGIPVVNAPARNAQAVVEFTLGLILAEYRSIGRAHCALSQGRWSGDLYQYDATGRELCGQTFGLVGFGAIAQSLVPYLHPFDLRILAYDPFVSEDRMVALGVEKHSLNDVLALSDIVSIHARVTPETERMMGPEQFARMKQGSYFINTARGPLVDYDALYEVLVNGHLAGAGLDTFPVEPPPSDWPLLRLPNVTLTPHIAGSSKESAEKGADLVARDIAAFFAGRALTNCVNPNVLA